MGVPEEGIVEINLEDADKLGISDGDGVILKSKYGQVELVAKIDESSPVGTLFMPVHFAHAYANVLLNPKLDATSHTPELKMCQVNIAPKA